MVYFISFLIYTLGVLTVVQGVRMLKYRTSQRKPYILYALVALSSAIWSFGFGVMWIQTSFTAARFWRSVGMVGTFLFFFTLTEFLVQWIQGKRILKYYFCIVSVLGIFLWPFVIGEESVTFYHTWIGMTYQFSKNIWNSIYNIFCVWVGINSFWVLIHIFRRAKRRKLKAIMRQLILCVLVVMIGMIFDTLLPVFGYDAIPGSTITQGMGILMLARIVEFQKTSEVTVENISKYVYYYVDTPVLIYDENKKFRIANEGAVEFFGEGVDTYKNITLCKVFALQKNCMEFPGQRKIEEVECLLNNRFCQVEIDKVYDEYQEITGYIVVINDLTEKRDFIAKLQESEYEAERANQAKSDFLARMSHEIRTPINGIIGMNEMILKHNTDEQVTGCAQMIRLSAQNLLELVNDILDISKIEADHVELENTEYRLQDILKEVFSIAYVKAGESGIEVNFEIHEPLPSVLYGDGKKLRQVVINVVGNAFKYTKEGSVCIHITGFYKEEQYYLQVIVRDTGIGIKQENMEKIFGAFERVDGGKNQGIEGTGLGLSIAKNLVRIMEGTISVSSEYGKGTEFVITVPQKPVGEETFQNLFDQEEQQQDSNENQLQLHIPGKRILVVDDNEINRIVANELLAYTQAEIDVADGGIECLQMVKEKAYDFILLDHIMPGMDGVRVLDELRKLPDNKSRDAVMIIFTANAIEGAKEDYLSKGFDDYLSKPINVAQIDAVLRKYCD